MHGTYPYLGKKFVVDDVFHIREVRCASLYRGFLQILVRMDVEDYVVFERRT